jgi:hypothetical protein
MVNKRKGGRGSKKFGVWGEVHPSLSLQFWPGEINKVCITEIQSFITDIEIFITEIQIFITDIEIFISEIQIFITEMLINITKILNATCITEMPICNATKIPIESAFPKDRSAF